MTTFNLINEINEETKLLAILRENCSVVTDNIQPLAENADKMIGTAIAALKAGKNPFENDKTFKVILAGLMVLASDTNREALNLDHKQFDMISKFIDEDQKLKKKVAQVALDYGKSLIDNLDKYVVEKDKRNILIKKLVKIQQLYSKVKHGSMDKVSNVA